MGLYGNARQSDQSLGRPVSLSAPAVMDRLNRLRSKGILQGLMLMIDSSVFERDDLLLFFHDNFSRKSVLAAFAAPDISWVSWKVDGQITLRLWTKNEWQLLRFPSVASAVSVMMMWRLSPVPAM